MDILVANIFVTVLIAARIIGFFLVVPVFSMTNIPTIVRIWLVIFISLVAGPHAKMAEGLFLNSWPALAMVLTTETILGASLGLVFSFALNSLYVAGSIIDMGIGFSMVNVYSPVDDQEIPITTNIFYTFALIVLFVTNGHHLIIRGMIETFQYMPIGSNLTAYFTVQAFLEVLTKSYVIGIQLALPFIFAIAFTNIVLGILSKAMPGMNIFTIGMPLNVFSGLMIMTVATGYYFNVFDNLFVWSIETMNAMYRLGG